MVRRRVDEPNMSDNLLLVKVEDLINMALGPADKNVVNFKLVQMILHILARNLRMLETQVEIRISEVDELKEKKWEEESTESFKSPGSSARGRVHMKGIDKHNEHKGKKDKHKHQAETASSKEREKAAKEREKSEKTAAKEREKAQKMEKKEKQKAEKAAAKEKLKAEQDAAKGTKEKGKARKGSGTSIAISEQERDKEKVLVVEKGPTTRTDSRTRVGSIEVVTVSQFEMLESAVNQLKTLTGSFPSPKFPDNKKLMEDVANGTASLTDIMQAMQVTARIKAAEQAIGRMADLLTQLAAAGAIPEELVEMVEEVKAEVDEVAAAAAATAEDGEEPELSMRSRPSAGRRSVAIEALSSRATGRRDDGVDGVPGVKQAGSATSSVSKMVPLPPISHREMDDALRTLKEDLNKTITFMTGKATTAAENASTTARGVAEKLDVAVKLNSRITTLYSLVNDYSDQLNGFDTGLTTQLQGFQDQMGQMRTELKGGMAQLSQGGGNSETAAVMELTERYNLLVAELDAVLHEHRGLSSFQKQLGDELHSLVECVEMLREQKADRDEVQDGLRDKADISRLTGLLTEKVFGSARDELERRLELCHDKFRKQELVWMDAIKDLTQTAESKAALMELLAARDDAQLRLRDLQCALHRLADVLGEPTAALLTRKLARDAACGACMVPALMSPWDAEHGAPPPLPALRPPPAGAERAASELCLKDFEPPPPPPDAKAHTCLRWVGGSHTLISNMVTKEKARPMELKGQPTKRYTGYGSDGRLYMLEEEVQPCVECNTILQTQNAEAATSDMSKDGAGDRESTHMKPDKNSWDIEIKDI